MLTVGGIGSRKNRLSPVFGERERERKRERERGRERERERESIREHNRVVMGK